MVPRRHSTTAVMSGMNAASACCPWIRSAHPITAIHAVSPLEGFKAHEWVCFERALVVRDLFTGGVRTFFSTADAQHFRTRLYQHYGASGCIDGVSRD